PSPSGFNAHSNGLPRKDGLSKNMDSNTADHRMVASVASKSHPIPRKPLNSQTPLEAFMSYMDVGRLSSLFLQTKLYKNFQLGLMSQPLLKTEDYLRKSQLQMKKIRGADLIIIDDLMYMAMDQNEANLFFHLVNHLYERSAVILTSNKGPEEWGELLGDQGITTAILDRLLHRSEVLHLDGESHRIKHRKTLFQAKSVQN